ncbi:acetyltransferase [Brucepastera parasyntrophica]|uniref:GNAT family N-acetyltransferase n=1 Tax=Brucepastera parasyntrophica TaxID=2880008 RepID=UPI00210BC855|nr:GNAT family N-acetyltransferase [Brucepastera parasyntrophica]ULQ60326.1 acetyltransferase [Brucepastera parasyntrophica]
MENINISFNKLELIDFDLMYKWLNTESVKKWYFKKDWTYDDVVKEFTPYVLKQKTTGEPIESFTILYNDIKIGYIQTYLLKDYPEYDQLVQAGEDSAGLDLFIGEQDYAHKGLGSIIILEFLRNIVFINSNIKKCIIGPEPKNTVAIKAYGKVGFKYIKTIQVPEEDEPEYIMEIKREEIV